MDKKIPVSDFCKLEGKSKYAVYRLFKVHPKLKAKIDGERGYRVNITFWERLKERA